MSEQKLDLIISKLEELSVRIDRIETTQTDDVLGMIKLLSSKIDLIVDGQERQDRIMELLSSRSIEQEALINVLKRR